LRVPGSRPHAAQRLAPAWPQPLADATPSRAVAVASFAVVDAEIAADRAREKSLDLWFGSVPGTVLAPDVSLGTDQNG
jgi:hypothetical protein